MAINPKWAVSTLLLTATLAACQVPAEEPPAALPPFAGLGGTSWQLVEIQSMDDSQGTIRVDDPAKYTIAMNKDGSAAARLDCNRGMGRWKNETQNATGGSLEIGPLAVTQAFCPQPSHGDKLAKQLGYVRSYTVHDGRLHMSLMADGGILVWEPVRDAK